MPSTIQETVPLPADLSVRLEQLCDKLQRLAGGELAPNLIPQLVSEASVLQPQLVASKCGRHAAFLAGSIGHLTAAIEAWATTCVNPTTSTTLAFEDHVFQALDEACWALTWQPGPRHDELAASASAVALQATA